MPQVLLSNATWAGCATSSGDRMREYVSPTINSGHVSQRIAFPPGAFPSASAATEFVHEFGNDQQITIGSGGFSNIVSPAGGGVSQTKYGARIFNGGGLEGNSYAIGEGFHYQEGALFVDLPPTRVYLGNDSSEFPEGRLSIRGESNSVARFWWEQANAAGNGIDEWEFDGIEIPIEYQHPAIPSRPVYFRLIRNLPGGGGGALRLRVWANGVASSQVITSIPVPNATPSTGRLGGTPIGETVSGAYRMMWWRSKWSNTYQGSISYGDANFWAAPKVFETETYLSHGDQPVSVVDSGIADVYWRTIQMPTLLRLAGGSVEVRFAASNSIPTGTALGLTSGSYTTVSRSFQEIELLDIQGRYLIIDAKFTPGTIQDMDFGEAAFEGTFAGASNMGFASWAIFQQNAPGAGTVELTVGGEGAAEATLPHSPHYITQVNETFRVAKMRAESGYTITRPLGTGSRERWSVRWTLDEDDANELLDFFDARRGGEGSFLFTPPGSVSQVTAALASPDVESAKLAPDVFELTAEFVEVKP